MIRRTAALLLAPLLVLVACASAPQTRRAAPEWVFAPPAADGNEYFVAVGSDAGGDLAAAEEQAAASLVTQINQALGVDVSVLTISEAVASLESYEANVRQSVTQAAAGRVEGFRVADRYIERADGRVTVHLLGEYERSAFLAERAERRSFLAAQEALFTEPEARGDQLAAQGRLTEALAAYLQAANAAARAPEGLREAPVVVERATAEAARLVSGIQLEAVDGPSDVPAGTRPDEPVVFRVLDRDGTPQAGVQVELSYPEPRGARSVIRRSSVVSDSDGSIRFSLPLLERVARIDVTARLDLAAIDPALRSLPAQLRDLRSAIEASLTAARATWSFQTVSRAREIPTTIVVVDTDATGALIPDARTSDGIAEAMSAAGFRLELSSLPPEAVGGRPMPELLSMLQINLPASVERAVVGTASITDFSESDGYLVRVEGRVSVFDLASGELLLAASAIKNARSSTAEQALATAFHQLGRDLGDRLAAELP